MWTFFATRGLPFPCPTARQSLSPVSVVVLLACPALAEDGWCSSTLPCASIGWGQQRQHQPVAFSWT